MLLWLLTACSGSPDVYIWSGGTYRWDKLSHRVSYVSALQDPDGGLEMGLRGGDWSTGDVYADTGRFRMRHTRLSGARLAVISGQTALEVGPEGEATEHVSLDAAELGEAADAAAVLAGWALDTDIAQGDDYPLDTYDPLLGYTSRGFGFALENLSYAGGEISFDVRAAVRWGPQDREDMNAAIPYARTAVTVAWTVIGAAGTPQSQAFSDGVDYPYEAPFSEQPALEGQALNLSLGGDDPAGVVGFSAFDLLVENQEGDDQGDYLRSFGAELVPAEERSDGFTGFVRAEATNSSILELMPIRFTASGTATWVPLDGVADLSWGSVSGSHPVGRFQIPPPETGEEN